MNITNDLLKLKKIFFSEIKGAITRPVKIDSQSNVLGKSVVVLAHNEGGGTAVFLKNYLKEINADNIFVIYPISNCLRTVRYIITNYKDGTTMAIRAKDLNLFFKRLDCFSQLIINSLVTYNNIENFVIYLSNMVQERHIKTTVMFHELLPLCPNFTLTVKNEFCKLNCLHNNCIQVSCEKIRAWRNSWNKLLQLSDEIRVFDDSIKELVNKVYPDLKIKVIPHEVTYFKSTPIENFYCDSLRIGVVGTISKIKGKVFLQDFLKFLKKNNQEIYLFGTSFLWSRNLIHTGKYTADNLKERLKKYNINVVLFPSICPETFSYVISELMILNMPIVCFDLGAQANRVRLYDRGVVCDSFDSEDVYKAIESCYERFILKNK